MVKAIEIGHVVCEQRINFVDKHGCDNIGIVYLFAARGDSLQKREQFFCHLRSFIGHGKHLLKKLNVSVSMLSPSNDILL